MSQGLYGKRRRALSDWVVRPLEGRVLLSQATAPLPTAAPAAVASDSGRVATKTALQASTLAAAERPSVTLTATVTAPRLRRPVSAGLVRFSVVSPSPRNLGTAHPDSRGNARLKTTRLNQGEDYVIQAQYLPPGGAFARSSSQLNVAIAPSPAASFRITAPQYYGAPGTPVTFSIMAIDRAGRLVTDYTGTVQFVSPTDHSAKFLTKTYTFTTADHGRHEFFEGVTFHKGGAEVVKVSQVNNTRISASQAFGIE